MTRDETGTGTDRTNDGGGEPPLANADQAIAWNGPDGESWARHSSRRVADGDLVEPLVAAAEITGVERVLDVGCGDGALTRRMASVASTVHAHGVDISALLIEQARRLAAEQAVSNVSFEVADAQVVAFPSAHFDIAVSHFGMMFFADPTTAFANVAHGLRPGGRLLFVCPQAAEQCEWYTAPLAAILGRPLGADEAPSAMFSLAEPAVVRAILAAAGFEQVELTVLDRPLWFGADTRAAAEAYQESGPVRAIVERTPGVSTEDAARALVDVMGGYLTADGVRIPGSHWLVSATRA